MRSIRLAAMLSAVLLAAAGCSADKKVNLPVAAYTDVANTTTGYLDQAIAAVKQAGPAGPAGATPTPSEDRRDVGPAPCSEHPDDQSFHVTGYDVAYLAGSAHRSVLDAISGSWSKNGYSVKSLRSLGGGKEDLILAHPSDGYTVEWSSSDDLTRLVITVTSPCVIAPDGEYPH
jgi:hypothetical protein